MPCSRNRFSLFSNPRQCFVPACQEQMLKHLSIWRRLLDNRSIFPLTYDFVFGFDAAWRRRVIAASTRISPLPGCSAEFVTS